MSDLLRPVVLALVALLPFAVSASETEAGEEAAAAPGAEEVEAPQAVIQTSRGRIVVELFERAAPETVANFLELAAGAKTWKDAEGAEHQEPFYDGLTFHRVIPDFMIQGGCPVGDGSGGPGYQFGDEINAEAIGLDDDMVLSEQEVEQDGQRVVQPMLHQEVAYLFDPNNRQARLQIFENFFRPRLEQRGITRESPQEQQMQAQQEIFAELKAVSLKAFYEGALGYRYQAELPTSYQPKAGTLAMANAGPGTNGSQFFINLIDNPHLRGKHTVFGRVIEGMDVARAIAAVTTGPGNRPVEPVLIEWIRRRGEEPASAEE